MAWMLEEVVRVILILLVEHLFKGAWRVAMDTKRCKIKRCNRTAASGRRGLCLICYGKAKHKVDTKETTWERLAELGLCDPDIHPFDEAYREATEGK